jgi:methyl-accepting chemotaxis protein
VHFLRRSTPQKHLRVEEELAAIVRTHLLLRLGPAGEILGVNDAFCDLTGHTHAAVVGKPYTVLLRAKDHSLPETTALWPALAGGEAVNRILPWLNAAGEEIWLDVTFSPVCDADGKVLHAIALAREISNFHLRRRDNRSQVDAVKRSMAVIEFDLEGTILDANDRFLQTMGYRIEEIRGKHHRIFVDPAEVVLPAYATFWTRLATGSSEKGQVKRIDKSGKVHWLEATYETLLDPEGRPFKVVKYAFDITDAKNMAADAASQIAAIQKVQAVIEFDPQGNILHANKNFCDVMGYDEAEIRGKPHGIFVDPGYRQSAAYAAFWDGLRAGRAVEDKFERIGKGGRRVHIRASYNPICDAAGHVVKVVKFAIDTTLFQVTADTMLHGLKQLAAGDLSVRLTQNLGDLDAIRAEFNIAIEKVESVIGGVVARSRTIAGETEAITSATNELARRTEHQAATLEESAAALAQLSASVKSAAGMAVAAEQKAARARADTEGSAQVVGEAVKAMDAIADSSRQISSITNVIDDIAFQTNLLALNAGVEAARAGDAGRGFAVVASEVRALAQRSSEAAKEIEHLISASHTQVDQGVKLVGQAGDALRTIQATVTDIHQSVVQISNATQEQATGLAEMNVAVNQLDQATQQNAGMAEQTNASVQSLSLSVQEMQADVAFFDLAPAPEAENWGARDSLARRA